MKLVEPLNEEHSGMMSKVGKYYSSGQTYFKVVVVCQARPMP